MTAYPHLLSPITLGNLTMRNRLVMGSMHTGLEDSPRHLGELTAYFAERARGGVGLIITGGYSPNKRGWLKPFASEMSTRMQAMRHRDGVSPAWPFSYDELEPWYSAAEQLYQVRGTTDQDPTEPFHSRDYPFKPVPDEPAIAKVRENPAPALPRPRHSWATMTARWRGDGAEAAGAGWPAAGDRRRSGGGRGDQGQADDRAATRAGN